MKANKKIMLACAAFAFASQAQGQSLASFEEFRQGIMNDYQEFRRTILDHYADFLEGTWHEYEPLMPAKKDDTPKPVTLPNVKEEKPAKPVVLPDPVTIKTAALPRPDLAQAPDAIKTETPKLGNMGQGEGKIGTAAGDPAGTSLPPSPFAPPKCVIPEEAKSEVPLTLNVNPQVGTPILGDIPRLPVKLHEVETETPDISETRPVESSEGKDAVNFYGMEMLVPHVEFKITDRLEKVSDFARHWKTLDEQEVADKLIPVLEPKFREWGLNDYLAMEFLQAYFDSRFPDAALSSKMSAVHYMITNMGYNARLAVATKTGDPIILVPSDQMLYGITYMKLGGDNYFVLGNRNAKIAGQGLATCDLPKGANSGKKFDLKINGLNLPVKEHKFDVSYKDLRLTGSVNENLMPLVYRYPQMETQDYAVSTLDPKLREDLVRQMREQLQGKDTLKATNDLLQFVQFGFEYATDDDFHGFEKPYFLEENFFYPKNDCEDRSIFYTYMLWNALGLDNQLLAFPGHESASVSLPEGYDVKGTSYTHDGKRYYISDPTYQGSSTGQCMRQFETTAPKIDYTYQ